MSRMLGAPFGGTTRGGHHGLESLAVSLITPPNFGSGGGSCLPSIVVVASGEPSVPVVCCANDEAIVRANVAHTAPAQWMRGVLVIFPFSILRLFFAYGFWLAVSYILILLTPHTRNRLCMSNGRRIPLTCERF